MPIEEIIVRGRQPPQPGPVDPFFMGGFGSGPYIREQCGAGPPPDQDPWLLAIAGLPAAVAVPAPPTPPPATRPVLRLVPKTAPPAIPEIIVKAQRLTAMHAAFASILGSLGAYIARDISQARLDEAFREFKAPDAFRPGDSPLQVTQPQPIPEIVVTATRAQQLRAQGVILPPAPQFFPSEMPEAFPATVPLTVPAPAVQPQPFAPPQPRPLTRPAPRPRPLPLFDPVPSPWLTPRPGLRPVPVPNPLTAPGPGGVGLPVGFIEFRPFLNPQAQPKEQRKRCKKCKEDKPRKRCYRKLVKEATKPKDDKAYRWQRIDCKTGENIRKPKKKPKQE